MSVKAALASKAEEVAYVRGEKVADETALEKLEKAYGKSQQNRGQTVRRRIWTCAQCQFRNTDTRDCCGQCLEPNPAVLSPDKKGRNDLVVPRSTQDPSAKLVTIGGRTYREFSNPGRVGAVQFKKPSSSSSSQQQQQQQQQGDDDEDEPSCKVRRTGGAAAAAAAAAACNNNDNDDDDDEYNDSHEAGGGFGSVGDGREDNNDDADGICWIASRQCFVKSAPCPSAYHKFIIGKGGATINELQRLTGATVRLGEKSDKQQQFSVAENTVEVSGPTRNSVGAALTRIESIIAEMVNKVQQQWTHFVSIPLAVSSDSKSAYSALLQDILRLGIASDDMDPFMFQKPAKLHLTLLMLRLASRDEIETAKALLSPGGAVSQLINTIFGADGAKIGFHKLDIMNDDPSEAHVVYLSPPRNPVTQKMLSFISALTELFVNAGLAQPKDANHVEKIHATVVNSKWRAGSVEDGTAAHFSAVTAAATAAGSGSGGEQKRSAPRRSFDASELLRMFSDVTASCGGPHRLERIDLSCLGAGVAADGYFTRECSAYFQ